MNKRVLGLKKILRICFIMAMAILISGVIGNNRVYAKNRNKTVVKKKSISLYEGKTKTVKLKKFSKAKSVKIKVLRKSVVSIKRKKKSGGVKLKGKKIGVTSVTVRYRVGKKKYLYKIKIKVIKNTSDKNDSTTKTSKDEKTTKSEAKYKYNVKVISQGTLYDDALVYVETDNPDGSFHFEMDDCNVTHEAGLYDNIPYINGTRKVKKNGFIVGVSLNENSNNVLELYENREGTYGIDTGIRITIKTGDSAKDEDAYMDAMIENAKKIIGYKKKNGYKGYDMYYKDSSGELSIKSLTFDEMSENELVMSELRCMVQGNYTYLKICNGGTDKARIVTLFGIDDKKSWESNCINCLEATRIMRAFAKKLGLASESTYAGYESHYYATVTIYGNRWIFDACPYEESGYIADNSWEMIDVDKIANNSNAIVTIK